ncbi:MAG: hypothetical protein QM691_18500 [Opitutaceae bacterium]
MIPLRRLFTFVLLGLWLIATQHCGLEAAGVLDEHAEESTFACCSESGPCVHDDCGQIERGSLPGTSTTLKLSPPALHACTCALRLLLNPPVFTPEPAIGHAARLEQSVGWVPTWHFTRRAAQSPRAPSLSLA